ncbi:MAG TPA: SLAC1 anion channel family protein [Methanocella sp.]|nr:SLAC1 anion channel family protein [Methanocella sp.]
MIVKLPVKNFPISLFTCVMGIGSLSIAYQRYADIVRLPFVSDILLAVAYLLFVVISLVYFSKLISCRTGVLSEFDDPVKANFFAAISISLLVLGTATFAYQRPAALALWAVGAVLHLIILIVVASRWIVRDFEITQLNPAWFLPAAGNLLVPIIGVEFVGKDILWFYFSVGLFFWLALFIVIFYRITFHRRLAEKFVPTLFIIIAPPALGFISYVKLTGTFDLAARMLLNLSLFLTLLLLFILPYFFKVRFSISWWAYTFPLCVVTIAVILAYHMSGTVAFAWISTLLLILSSVAVCIVSLKTLSALKRNVLFED